MAICSTNCGVVAANVPKPIGNCELNTRRNSQKGFIAVPCATDTATTPPIPAWNAPEADKLTWLATVQTYSTSITTPRSYTINEAETTDVKILKCSPSFEMVTEQTIELEDVVAMTSAADDYLDYTIYEFIKGNIAKLNLIGIDCDNNLYPYVIDATSTSPTFSNFSGRFSIGEEEISDCKIIEVKRAVLKTCDEINQFVRPWILGSQLDQGFIDAVIPSIG